MEHVTDTVRGDACQDKPVHPHEGGSTIVKHSRTNMDRARRHPGLQQDPSMKQIVGYRVQHWSQSLLASSIEENTVAPELFARDGIQVVNST